MAYASKRSAGLATNGFRISLPQDIEVIVSDVPDPSGVRDERERLADHWFVHWVGGKLYHLRLQTGGPNIEGERKTLATVDCMWLLRGRVDDIIGLAFSKYSPVRERPFTFLAQRTELIQKAVDQSKIVHELLSSFRATPRFELNVKTYEDERAIPGLGVFVTVGVQNDILAELPALQSAGVPLHGCYVVRRNPEPDQHRLAGRVDRLEGGVVYLMEGSDEASMPATELKLEGSTENMARSLTALLGVARYRAFRNALDDQEAEYRLGPEFDKIVEQTGSHLMKTVLPLADGIEASIVERITLRNSEHGVSVRKIAPVDYVFDRTGRKSAPFAWKGLSDFGPYDREVFPTKSPRVLAVYPTSAQGKVENFLKSLRDGMGANYKAFPNGFVTTFGLVGLTVVQCPVEVAGTDREGTEGRYREAIERKLASDPDIHVALVFLFEEHAHLPDVLNPYLRTKGLLLTLGIPSQEIRMPTVAQSPGTLQYTLQNIAVALYAKLNGTPWTVNQDKAISDELVLGMGFAELSENRFQSRQRFVGITTVFGGDGTYILGNVSRECDFAGYPDMLRESITGVLRELKKRNNWQPGDIVRVIFHAHQPLKRVDVARIAFDCAAEVGAEQTVQLAFVTVAQDHPFYLFDYNEEGTAIRSTGEFKGVFAPVRGCIARLGKFTRLLAVNSGPLIKRANSPLPKPLLVSLHPDSTFKDVDYISEQILKFTSLSWRSTLPAGTPVTIFYSERIAELLGRLKSIPLFSPSALAVKLRWSRWFL